MRLEDFDNFFDLETTGTKRKQLMDNFIKEYAESCYHKSLPRQFYPFLHKILTYRIGHERSKYKLEDIRTFFISKDEYGHLVIAFFDVNGKYEPFGLSGCLQAISKHNSQIWDEERKQVVQILRNIAKFQVNEFYDSITLPCKSAISNEIIKDKSNLHIDHYDDDFSKVAFDWMMTLKQNIENKQHKLVDIVHSLYKIIDEKKEYFTDKRYSRSFYKWHIEHTHLRAITKNENLKREKYCPDWSLLKINGRYKYENNK